MKSDALIAIVKRLAQEHREELEERKKGALRLDDPGFLWDLLLENIVIQRNATNWYRLRDNSNLYARVGYLALQGQTPKEREQTLASVLKDAAIPFRKTKVEWLVANVAMLESMGGVEAAGRQLLALEGKDAKLQFVQQFAGIGDKSSRNMMMLAYHPDFRNSIAVDARIKSISAAQGLKFKNFAEHERYYIALAERAGLEPWELDRILFHYQDPIVNELQAGKHTAE